MTIFQAPAQCMMKNDNRNDKNLIKSSMVIWNGFFLLTIAAIGSFRFFRRINLSYAWVIMKII